MRDPFQSTSRKRHRIRLIEIDSWVDTGLFRIGRFIATKAEAFSVFMRRFRLTGVRRAAVEVAGDTLTLGLGGALLMLALALPAFDATRNGWRSQGDYSVTFLDRNGNEIGKRGVKRKETVPLEEMPDHLIKAVLATEDRRFYDHFGIDVAGTIRAMGENLRADAVVQGGSSLSQQLAKNLFLSNERTLERKIKEAFLALWLEANLSKNEILKLYLDRAYMGGGNFGVEAASDYYFGKSVKDVNLSEAALLAGLFKAPARYAPHVNLPAARARANEVLTNMVQAGFLTEGQVIGARRHPANVIEQSEGAGSPNYFMDWAFDEVKKLNLKGDRSLTVRTTVDLGMQKAADEAVESVLREKGDAYRARQAAMVVVEPDGAVRAMVGGRDYGESQFNRATDALRQPGSSFKPFVYATAMMNGYTPKSVVRDAPICIGGWCPHNYSGGYSGPVSLTTALVKSINIIPVRLAQAIGRDKIVETAHKMGLTTELLITRSLPLGAAEVKVVDMAGAYAVFANGGYKATPYAFTQVMNSRGDVLYDRRKDAPPPERVLPEQTVADMNGILSQVPEWGTGRRAKLEGIKTAGKTGTTSAYRDAWFVGFTGNYAAAVWMGNDNYQPTRRLTGGSLPAMTWNKVMTYAHNGIKLKPIPYVDDPDAGKAETVVAEAESPDGEADAGAPATLSTATTAQLIRLEELLRSAPVLKPVAALGPGQVRKEIGLAGADPATTHLPPLPSPQ
ncbi:transglycosylase domain-containing protein [Bauldia sp.]|uniref:transglycosylase domain-containing protein n=1 Tax=Bauldia sp. TaxID=2575872 RepID=UPI0025C34EFA|nr:penicillin-binding protein 1A [Bauldia sp.]